MLLEMALFHFLWLIFIYVCVCIFFIHSSIDGHLGCFHVLTTVNSVAMNIMVHVHIIKAIYKKYSYLYLKVIYLANW